MANLKGVVIKKGRIGANVLAGSDAVSGMIIPCSAPINGGEFGDIHEVYNMKDVENLGLTADTDKSKNENAYRHISEFYRIAGEGTKLFFVVAGSNTIYIYFSVQYLHE
ncbi:MAG: hypothetical protein CSA05_03725 [Bacteroidia bacterium]|nr:MAG: hypothetical protein CSA05_03725 [Bacteroidia bacterium]